MQQTFCAEKAVRPSARAFCAVWDPSASPNHFVIIAVLVEADSLQTRNINKSKQSQASVKYF